MFINTLTYTCFGYTHIRNIVVSCAYVDATAQHTHGKFDGIKAVFVRLLFVYFMRQTLTKKRSVAAATINNSAFNKFQLFLPIQ